MRRVMIKGLLAHKLRLALTALSVVLGVAFVAGTFVLTDTLGADLRHALRRGRRATPTPRSAPPRSSRRRTRPTPTRGPVQDSAARRRAEGRRRRRGRGLRAGPGPDRREGRQARRQPEAPSFGGSASGLGTLSPFKLKEGRAPKGDDEVVIDAATAKNENFALGDKVRIEASQTGTYTLVGIVGFGSADNLAGATFVLWDMPTAQRVLHRLGEFDEIAVKAAERRVPAGAGRSAVAGPAAGLEAVTSDVAAAQAAGDVKDALGFFNTFLLAFAAVALFVGSFIIFNTFTIIVAQRLRELALLRALGASRKQVTRSVLAEALIVGFVASLIGVGGGVARGRGL